MVRLLRSTLAAIAVACLSLTGCLVSFEDYPLAGSGGVASASGTDSGSAAAAGSSAGDAAASGASAGTANGAAAAGNSAGGSADGGSPAGGSPARGMPQGGAPGGSSQGGSAGTAVPPSELQIDDFEDGDSQLTLVGDRNGSWFTSNDGTPQAQQSPDPSMDTLPSLLAPPRGSSKRALHTSGSGFNTWGALIGANFAVVGPTAMPYDISLHQGLTFSAKLGKPGVTKQVRVSIRNYDTLYGCTGCGDHFGATATLGDTFQSITVPFSSLKQQGWGRPQVAAFDGRRSYAVTFTWAAHQPFDVWIDDLCFN